MKELDSKVAGGSEDPQQIQLKSKTQLSSTVRPVGVQPPCLLIKKIGKGVLLGCESINLRTMKPVKSCASVFVEHIDKDKDADENVDADQARGDLLVDKQLDCPLSSMK